MIDIHQWALVLTVALPFIGVLFILLFRDYPDKREATSLVTAVLTFLLVLFSLVAPVSTPAILIAPGLEFQLAADALGLLFASLASLLWIITTVYSIGYMRGLKEHAQTRYYVCFAMVIGSVMGLSLAANLFTLFFFYEILTVATYPLVAHSETPEALAAGRKYLFYTLSGGVAVFAGMLMLLQTGNALEFVAGGNADLAAITPDLARLAFLLLFAGFGVKTALVPLHGWLPTAMIAPTPVSGLLHAVAVVNAGVFGIFRVIFYLYGPGLMIGLGLQEFVIAMAVITILIGSFFALLQDDLKLRLVYSTISQLSYMVLGAAVLLPAGVSGVSDAGRAAAVIGATFAFAAHAFGKLTMFFVAGAVAVETGKTKVSELDGLGRKMPWEFMAFTLASLSMAGLPLVGGFIAKWYLNVGIVEGTTSGWWILLVLVASSVLNLAYFLPIIIRAFFKSGYREILHVRSTLRAPILVTAAGTLILGIWTGAGSFFALSAQVAASVTHTALLLPQAFAMGTTIPPFLIFLVGAPLVLALRGDARKIALIMVGAVALIVVLFLPGGFFIPVAGTMPWQIPFMGYTLTLVRVDSLSYLMGVIFAIITFLAILYAAVIANPRLHVFALLFAGSALGVVFAGDWITLLIFWEIMAVTSAFLIWQERGEAIGAGYRYLLFHIFGGALLGAGIALLYLGGGSPILGPLGAIPDTTYQFWASVLIVIGIGVNAGFIFLHTWIPDSYPRANFVASVFLSVYTTKAAVYLLARAQPGTEYIAIMGGLMAVFGVVFAIFQNDMRRLLSYHIISQVGYMVAGVGIFGWLGAASEIGNLGLNGGMAHVFNHILYKGLLFMAIGVIIWKTGENTLDRVGGLQKKMPVTALAFWIAALSISGVPLFNGYVSKAMVLAAAEQTSILVWILLEIASFGTFLSFIKLGYFAFLRPGATEARDPPLLMQAGMLGAAALCILIGVYPQVLYALLPSPVTYQVYNPVQVIGSLVIFGLAAAFFFTIGKRILEPHETDMKDIDVAYRAAGRGICTFSGVLQDLFRNIYQYATAIAGGLVAGGKLVMRMEGRDVNWNIAIFAASLVAVLAFLFLGVTT